MGPLRVSGVVPGMGVTPPSIQDKVSPDPPPLYVGSGCSDPPSTPLIEQTSESQEESASCVRYNFNCIYPKEFHTCILLRVFLPFFIFCEFLTFSPICVFQVTDFRLSITQNDIESHTYSAKERNLNNAYSKVIVI